MIKDILNVFLCGIGTSLLVTLIASFPSAFEYSNLVIYGLIGFGVGIAIGIELWISTFKFKRVVMAGVFFFVFFTIFQSTNLSLFYSIMWGVIGAILGFYYRIWVDAFLASF